MRRKFPTTLLAVALVFFGPLAAAVFLYAGWSDTGRLPMLENEDRVLLEGERQIPLEPLALADGSFSEADWARSRWSMIYARMSPCDEPCLRELRQLSQVYYALGNDRDRVRRVLLFQSVPEGIQAGPDLLVGKLPEGGTGGLEALLGGERAVQDGRVFLADPSGNLVVSYPPDADQARLLRDLERLLDLSGIG